MKITNVGNIVRGLGRQIIIKDIPHVELLKKAEIEIVSTLSSGRGTSYFINEDDVKRFEEWLLQKYPNPYTKPSKPTLSETYPESLSKLQAEVSSIFEYCQLINKKLDEFTQNLISYIDEQSPKVIDNPEIIKKKIPEQPCDPQFLKQFSDSWKNTVKSLGLVGTTHQLALQTNVIGAWKEKDKYIICLNTSSPNLVSSHAIKPFTSALAKHFKLPVELTICDLTGGKNEQHSSFH